VVLRKAAILNLCERHGFGTLLIIVRHIVNPRAHRIAPHQPSIKALKQFGRRSHILHAGAQPQIVAVWIEDHWHAVVHR
jgi:hypothetical protein